MLITYAQPKINEINGINVGKNNQYSKPDVIKTNYGQVILVKLF